MIVIANQAHLHQLGISTSFQLALPDSACAPGARIPCIVCLHDTAHNGERLLQSLCCERLVDEANVALLLPDGQNGCFMNMAHGPKWETYLTDGLAPFAERTFPLQTKPRLFGLGTGGWAAARLYARYPSRFTTAAAVNAPRDLPDLYAAGKLPDVPDLEAVFGNPGQVPAFPTHPQTLWLDGVSAAQALATLLDGDWSVST